MLKKILLTIGLLVGSAFAQGGAASGEVRFPNGQTVPYANVLVCNTPANGVPCSNKASLFTDATLGTPISNPIVLQPINFGAWSFGAAQGNYVIQVSGPGYNTASFPVTFGIPSGTSIAALTVTNLTVGTSILFNGLTISGPNGGVIQQLNSGGDSVFALDGNKAGPVNTHFAIGAIVSNNRNGDVNFSVTSSGAIDPLASISFINTGLTFVRFNDSAPQLSFEVGADGASHLLVVTFANLPAATSSHMVYCSDCTNNAGGHTAGAACANAGTGALAIAENSSWRCF